LPLASSARRTSTLADTVEAVVSWRSEGRLAENDQVVTEAGFALYVKTDYTNEAANRTAPFTSANDEEDDDGREVAGVRTGCDRAAPS
jgi:hypothetical protein